MPHVLAVLADRQHAGHPQTQYTGYRLPLYCTTQPETMQGVLNMTVRDQIDLEIRNQAVRLLPNCVALFELPLMVYNKIMMDNATRVKPYRVSEMRIRKVISSMNL